MRTDPPVVDSGVIELGVIPLGPGRPELDHPVPAAPPAVGTPGRPRHGLLRWWPLLLLSGALLAGTGAAAPMPAGLTLAFQIPTDPQAAVALTTDTLYLATGTPASVVVADPVWRVTAYRLRDGQPVWTVPHDPGARHSSIGVTVVDGLPLVTGWQTHTQAARPAIDVAALTTAYDPATGAVRWSLPGFVAAAQPGPAGSEVTLELTRYTGNPPEAVDYTVTGVDVATGAVRWQHRLGLGPAAEAGLPPADAWTLSEAGTHLVTLTRDGTLTVRDLARGEPAVRELGQSWHDASVVTTGDLLRVSLLKDRRRTLAVYDLATLRPRWQLSDLSPASSLVPCGPVLCLQSAEPLRGLDPATGIIRWEAVAGWRSPTPLPPPWPAGLLAVAEDAPAAGRATPDQVLVDARTGRAATALAGWRATGPDLVSGHPQPVVDRRGPGAERPGHPQYDPGRLWLGRPAPDLSTVRVLGSLDRVRDCVLGPAYLACVSVDAHVEVWHLH